MASISWSRFREIIKKASLGRARFSGSKTTTAAMVYLSAPIHPESDQRGLWEICSIGSPLFFISCPKESVLLNGNIVRGYQAFFWRAVRTKGPDGRPCLDEKIVRRMLPEGLKWRPAHDKRLKLQRAELRKTPASRLHEKVQPFLQDLKSLPGPDGKKRSRIPYWRKNHAKGGLFVPQHVMAG